MVVKRLTALGIIILIGGVFAAAGSYSSLQVLGVPLYAVAILAVFLIQWLAFIPAYLKQSEHFFDLVGALTYLSVTATILVATNRFDPRSLLLAVLVMVWAGRLGIFLFTRIHRTGGDDRFKEIKPDSLRFLITWTLQGLWVTVTAAAAWMAMSAATTHPIGVWAIIGLVIWLAGFSIEVVADAQKKRFRADPKNTGEFITTGLWSRSRHPNYFGEILLWVGVAVIAAPALSGWQFLGLVSPFFVALLLMRISGIPMLEARAKQRWGARQDYRDYLERTPVLIPALRSPQQKA